MLNQKMMKIFRISHGGRIRLLRIDRLAQVLLSPEISLTRVLSQKNPHSFLMALSGETFQGTFVPLAPIDDQDVWACGLTYFNSKKARLSESKEASVYDRVYSATRPQIFPKARGRDVVGEGEALLLREDSHWTVPEPELVIVINSRGNIAGCTLGNDLTCRDIEAENPLYQPQAKIWNASCVMGPSIDFGGSLLNREIKLRITRQGKVLFSESSNTSRIIRPLEKLVETLLSYRTFTDGAYLFTGTGIVPPDEVTLMSGDEIEMELEGVGVLHNPVSLAFEGHGRAKAGLCRHG